MHRVHFLSQFAHISASDGIKNCLRKVKVKTSFWNVSQDCREIWCFWIQIRNLRKKLRLYRSFYDHCWYLWATRPRILILVEILFLLLANSTNGSGINRPQIGIRRGHVRLSLQMFLATFLSYYPTVCSVAQHALFQMYICCLRLFSRSAACVTKRYEFSHDGKFRLSGFPFHILVNAAGSEKETIPLNRCRKLAAVICLVRQDERYFVLHAKYTRSFSIIHNYCLSTISIFEFSQLLPPHPWRQMSARKRLPK